MNSVLCTLFSRTELIWGVFSCTNEKNRTIIVIAQWLLTTKKTPMLIFHDYFAFSNSFVFLY